MVVCLSFHSRKLMSSSHQLFQVGDAETGTERPGLHGVHHNLSLSSCSNDKSVNELRKNAHGASLTSPSSLLKNCRYGRWPDVSLSLEN